MGVYCTVLAQYDFNVTFSEPDRFPVFNQTVSGEQLAKDYRSLRSVIRDRFPYFANSKVVGPAVANVAKKRGGKYLEEYAFSCFHLELR